MKPLRLLSYSWKRVGIVATTVGSVFAFLIISSIYHIPWLRVKVQKHNNYSSGFLDLNDELALSILLIGLLLIIFSREKTEGERTQTARFQAFQWAVLINCLLIFGAGWLLYEHAFMFFMLCNLILTPVLFITRFYYLLYRSSKELKNNILESDS